MSHIHNIGGASNAAAEYQAYLERLRASKRDGEEKVRTDQPRRSFDSAIDPERDPESEGEGEPETEDESKSRAETHAESEAEPQSESEAEAPSYRRYA